MMYTLPGWRLFLLTLSFVFFNETISAQDNKFKEVIPPSPNTASLGKYGEMPIGNHTGVPQISIPIYTVTEGELSVPINLSYHGSGIKVEELASWTGLGWSLDAGGMISRSVVGAPDEGNTRPGGHSDVNQTGWYKDNGMDPRLWDATCPNPNDGAYNTTIASSCQYRYQDVANGVADTEPDIFSFNFGGYSGQFFFNEYREVVLQPKQDVLIEPSTDFATWTITTPDGTKYTFGGATASEASYFGATGGCCSDDLISSTSWYLTKIENLNRTRWIAFSYVQEKYSYTVRPSHSVTLESDGTFPAGTTQIYLANAPEYTALISIKGVRLNSIATSSGLETLHFDGETLRQDISKYGVQTQVNNESMRLDKIRISNGSIERTFQFGYSYFTSSTQSSQPGFLETTHDVLRLKLESLQEISGSDAKAPYTFDYETTYPMARRLSLGRDHWGYYNGVDGNTGLIPNFTVPLHNFTGLANREVDETKMKAWTIKAIHYPTGGHSEYIFEAHRQSETSLVGGLRIKQIKVYDGLGNQPAIKNYTYDFGSLYAGPPNYVQNTTPHEYAQFSGPEQYFIVSSNLRTSLKSTKGYHIGYSTVIVSDGVNGKSTYRYFNSTPGYDYYFPPAPTLSEVGMGELFEETHQDQEGKVIQFTRNYFITDFTRAIRAKKATSAGSIVMVRNYEIREGRRLLLMKDEYKDGVTTRTHYTYSPNHNQPVKLAVEKSNGEKEETIFDYSKDRYVSACSINDSECRQNYNSTVALLRQQLNDGIAECKAYAVTTCENPTNWTYDDCRYMPFLRPDIGCQSGCRFNKEDDCIGSAHLIEVYQTGLVQAEQTYKSCRALVLDTYKNCVTSSINSLNATDKVLAKMITENVIIPFEQETFTGQQQTMGSKTIYGFQNDLLVPTDFYSYDHQLLQWRKNLSVNYDVKGNIQQTRKENDFPVSYLWGYSNTLPIAQISNANLGSGETNTNESHLGSANIISTVTETYISPPLELFTSQNVTPTVVVGPLGSISNGPSTPALVIKLKRANGSIAWEHNCSWGTNNLEVLSLTPGVYQWYYSATVTPTSEFFGYDLDITTNYVKHLSSQTAFHTSFEDSGVNSSDPKTGLKVWQGSYTLNLPGTNGTYKLTYWQKSGAGEWSLQEQQITVSSGSVQPMNIGASGNFIDEVRLYPVDAVMKTFTYAPLVGMTSTTDGNNVTTYYEYDAFGRLELVRDADRNILKHYKYHYQGGN